MDDEKNPNLKAAFAELHCQRREQAPPYGAMREEAMRCAFGQHRSPRRSSIAGRFAWAAAAVCIAIIAMRWVGELPETASSKMHHADSKEGLDALLTAIEQQLERSERLAFPEYPTDTLLAENQFDPW
jgi:hypothetical protein